MIKNKKTLEVKMIDLTTKYMGLTLKNPIIIASSGLTNSVDSIKKMALNGAGAIVLKSLFEEQINYEIDKTISQSSNNDYPEAIDYIVNYSKNNSIDQYLKLIEEVKKAVTIPVIASINCISANQWVSFAKRIQDAKADALELNIAILPSDDRKNSEENELLYFNIIEKVKAEISIPLSIKMSYYSSGLASLVKRISWTKKVDGIVLFNRYFSPDIDTEKLEITSSNVFSSQSENALTLRWVALLSGKIDTDIAATTGIHTGDDVVKQILAGAKAVQIASSIYKNGPTHITAILNDLEAWMHEHKYSSIESFRGKLGSKNTANNAAYERVQFMKHFAGID